MNGVSRRGFLAGALTSIWIKINRVEGKESPMGHNVLSFGWEADQLYSIKGKPQGVTITLPVLKPITIIGYQLDIAFMAWVEGGVFNNSGWAEVLFGLYSSVVHGSGDAFGPFVYNDLSPTPQNLHGGATVGGSGIASCILKGFVDAGMPAVDKSLIIPAGGLSLPLPANCSLVMSAVQAGAGPLDFEVQGNIFYTED